MKKIVIVIDSFKGSMSSLEAGAAAAAGIRNSIKAKMTDIGTGKNNQSGTSDMEIVIKPIADGGEGTTEALVAGLNGEFVDVNVTGPLGNPITARYGMIPKEKLAVMEMAEAAGITLLELSELAPERATTYGVGEMILDAVEKGCREFIVGIGGSATTDGGVGMLMALGYEFLDKEGKNIRPGIQALDEIAVISDEKVSADVKKCHFKVACDVKNPLLGENGAVYIFGSQKGVKDWEKESFDQKMKHYADWTAEFTGKDMRMFEGAGAAGGLGFAFLSYLNADLESGIEIVLDTLKIEKEFEDADIVITGEGRMDAQTAMGKVPVGIAALAKKSGCRVIAFAGGVTKDAVKCNEAGIDAFFPIVRGVTILEDAMKKENAVRNMMESVEQVFRLIEQM